MISVGRLTPEMTLLDLGCGCLRGGVKFIEYLDPGNYYGLDINESLLEAGYSHELTKHGLTGRLERDHLIAADDFGAWRFGIRFDRVLAVSVWTHLPLNHVQRSLHEVSGLLADGGEFYSSIFLCPDEGQLFKEVLHDPGAITTHRDRDPYHYLWDDIVHACRPLGLRAELVGDWKHPRAQQMVRITAS